MHAFVHGNGGGSYEFRPRPLDAEGRCSRRRGCNGGSAAPPGERRGAKRRLLDPVHHLDTSAPQRSQHDTGQRSRTRARCNQNQDSALLAGLDVRGAGCPWPLLRRDFRREALRSSKRGRPAARFAQTDRARRAASDAGETSDGERRLLMSEVAPAPLRRTCRPPMGQKSTAVDRNGGIGLGVGA